METRRRRQDEEEENSRPSPGKKLRKLLEVIPWLTSLYLCGDQNTNSNISEPCKAILRSLEVLTLLAWRKALCSTALNLGVRDLVGSMSKTIESDSYYLVPRLRMHSFEDKKK